MLNYYVMHDIVNNLDQKYKEQFTSFERIFYSSNYIKMMDFYNIFSIKGNNYELRDRFEDRSKQKELINYFITTIKEKNYDQEIILLAYGLVINKSIKHVCKPYFDSLCGTSDDLLTNKKKQKLERIISYHLRDVFDVKNKEYKKVPQTYKATENELETITNAFSNIFKLSNTKSIILKSQDNLQSYYNQNINFLYFKIRYYTFLDKCSKSRAAVRPCLRTNLFKQNIDYLNINKRGWLNPYTNKFEYTSFFEIYDEIIKDASIRINKLNEVIFYSDKKHNNIISETNFEILNDNLVNPIFKKNTSFKREIIKK